MSTDKTLNSHIFGTSVIVFSLFDDMDFGLLVPPPGKDYTMSQKEHKWHDDLTIHLDHGSVYVLDPCDDENYMHSAKFPKCPACPSGRKPCGYECSHNSRVRLALVYHWVSKRCPFYANMNGPLKDAMHVPNAVEKLSKSKQGKQWIRVLGLDT
jgi:hypothetical protein